MRKIFLVLVFIIGRNSERENILDKGNIFGCMSMNKCISSLCIVNSWKFRPL